MGRLQVVRIPYPGTLFVDVPNDEILESQRRITYLIMPPAINNFGGFYVYQMTQVLIQDDESKHDTKHMVLLVVRLFIALLCLRFLSNTGSER